MVISVLERRSEIGLRRALGATRGHIRVQFLAEAILLALLGGAAGVAAGAAATAVYAHTKGWATVIPAGAWAGGLAAAMLIGAVAGLVPALRAARMSPTEALWCDRRQARCACARARPADRPRGTRPGPGPRHRAGARDRR